MQVTYFLNGPMPSLLELVSLLNFLFSSFSILINFSYKSVGYLELWYLELSLCWTFFSLHSVIFGLFLIRYLEHSNEIFEWIILFISGIQMLITVFTKLCPEVCSFFFSISFWQQHVKTQWKKLLQEMSGFERPRKRSWNKN